MAGLAMVLGTFVLYSSPALAINYNYTGSVSNTAALASSLVVMCNTTFDRANGTGYVSITPGISQGSSSQQGNGTAFGSAVTYAYAGAQNTVQGTAGYGLQGSLLFSPGKADYFNDAALGYDACGLAIDPAVFNTNTYLRAQSDNGSCLQMLDQRCKAAIQDQVNNAAKVANNPSKQVQSSLDGVCSAITNAVAQAPPKECQPFLLPDTTKWILGYATLTENGGTSTSELAASCTLTDYYGNTFYNMFTLLTNGYSDETYNLLTTIPLPILTLFLPITNGQIKTSVITSPFTEVSCLHITHTNPGSKAIPVLAQPTPVDYSSLNSSSSTNSTTNSATSATPSTLPNDTGLNGGAIAGVVVGVLAALALVALAAFLVIRRRRRARRVGAQAAEFDDSTRYQHEHAAAEKRAYSTHSEAHGDSVQEMSPNSKTTSELSSPQYPKQELPSFSQRYEVYGGAPPVELVGSIPDKAQSGRYGR